MKGQEIKAEERDAIFGEIILEYSIFEEASLKKTEESEIPQEEPKL